MTTTTATTTCDLCHEHIDQHTGRYLVCPDGIHEFESIRDARRFEREAYLGLADEMSADDATLDDFDGLYVEAAKRFASRLGLPFPIRDVDIAGDLVTRAEALACDGFTGENAWGPCVKCGSTLDLHSMR